MEFALYINNTFSEIRNLAERPVDIEHKQVKWYPVSRENGEPFQGLVNDIHTVRTTVERLVPYSISPRQARLALESIGKLDEVDLLVSNADKATQISWNWATSFLRNDPNVISMASAVGITSEQLDNLFITAATL